MLICHYLLGWDWKGAQIAGVALSTTSLAVVYAVLVETGLTHTPVGKLIMASTFVTDFGTAAALAIAQRFFHPHHALVELRQPELHEQPALVEETAQE